MTARAERQDYLSLVIHELRNPLVGIDAAARVLSRELGGHPARQRASSIASEAQHLLGLLESLADAEAAAAGRLRSSPRPIDLAALVRETVDLQGDGHPITVRGADRPVPVDADARRIRQVLANLLANAQQYSPPGSPIDVAVEAGRSSARVEVRDRGPGIPAAERRRLFRKFARLSTADGTRGSGLGLYICRAIVEDHRGTIRHLSIKDGGSAFVIELPLKRSARAGDVVRGAAAHLARGSGGAPPAQRTTRTRKVAGRPTRGRGAPAPQPGASPARALRKRR